MPNDTFLHREEVEILVKLDNDFFVVAFYENGVGTHASYRDVNSELSGKVIGWINLDW